MRNEAAYDVSARSWALKLALITLAGTEGLGGLPKRRDDQLQRKGSCDRRQVMRAFAAKISKSRVSRALELSQPAEQWQLAVVSPHKDSEYGKSQNEAKRLGTGNRRPR